MIGLRTARAVVIDNNVSEGMEIVAALSKYGIGISFFKGEVEELPQNRLNGVRLLVLDMNLLDTYVGEVKAILSPLINFLDKLLADNSKPFAIIAWTKHPLFIEEFQTMLNETRPDLKPYFMAKIEVKKDDDPENYDPDKILKRLEEEAKLWFPLDLLMEWEQRVHDATSETTSVLTEIANEASGDWAQEATKLLSALALESGGKHTGREEKVIECLFRSLNPIHEDCLESIPVDHGRLSSQSEKLQDAINEEKKSRKNQKRSRLTDLQRSQLNRMLSLSNVKEGEHAPRPGNLYFKKGWETSDYPIGRGYTSRSVLGKEMLRGPYDDNEWRRIIDKCVPVIVEITPSCDYSQGKTSQCRFIMGLLVREEHKKKIKDEAAFIRKIGPFHVKRSDFCPMSGDYFLVLNSRYITAIQSSKIAEKKEAYRLRKMVLNDTQHWFANQAARPGYISIGNE
jgi:hypothetical protein